MAFETGTASNLNDLIAKLGTFLTTNVDLVAAGDEWTEEYSDTRAAIATETAREYRVWKGPGSTGLDDIYIGAYTKGVIATDIHNLAFAGGTFWNVGAAGDPEVQDSVRYGLQGRSKFVTLFADSIPFTYWFIANGRRFIVVTKMGSVYATVYCGFILPLARPDEYPYPLCVASGFRDPDELWARYSDTSTSHGSIMDPRSQSCWLMYPDQGWRDFYGTAVVSGGVADSSLRYVWPNAGARYYIGGESILNTHLPAVGGDYAMIPVQLCTNESAGTNTWGRYDGVYYLTGADLTAEDTIDVDGTIYMAVPSGFRNGVRDYFAVEIT